jgi:hypothetical protein
LEHLSETEFFHLIARIWANFENQETDRKSEFWEHNSTKSSKISSNVRKIAVLVIKKHANAAKNTATQPFHLPKLRFHCHGHLDFERLARTCTPRADELQKNKRENFLAWCVFRLVSTEKWVTGMAGRNPTPSAAFDGLVADAIKCAWIAHHARWLVIWKRAYASSLS